VAALSKSVAAYISLPAVIQALCFLNEDFFPQGSNGFEK